MNPIIYTLLISKYAKEKKQRSVTYQQVQERHLQEKTDHYEYDLHIPVILGIENEQLNKQIRDDINKVVTKYLNELKQAANEYSTSNSLYSLNSTYKIYTHNKDLLSVCMLFTNYFGGAHSMSYKHCFNYDLKSGMRLTLSDLLKEAKYKEVINEEIKRQIEKKNEKAGFKYVTGFKGINENQKFYINNGLLVIYFGLYEIAPYAGGIIEFTMPPSIYKEK